MSIFMTHPEHGSANVMEGDVEANQKNGWIVDTFEAWSNRVQRPEFDDAGIDALRIAYKEKFGKAAHHKKTAEWLAAELA